jgi:hypothetical protein
MKSQPDGPSDKTEKKSEPEVMPDVLPVAISSNQSGMVQEWQKFTRQFNHLYNDDSLIHSVRKRFCRAAIGTLQSLYDANKSDKRLEEGMNVKAVIDALKSSQSNLEIVNLFENLPDADRLKKLVRDKKIPMSLGRLMVHIRGCYFTDLGYDPEKILPVTAFEYKKLIELPENAEITTGDFQARPSKDFIAFYAQGISSSVNDTKLRLSVAENQFEKAWDLIKGVFLFPDSPIHIFKIINLKTSDENFKHFIERYQKYKSDNDASTSADSLYQKQLQAYQRLMVGGQITIYLPRKMDQTAYERITEFFEKITMILCDNDIDAGIQPQSDRKLNAYISGRVGGTQFDYIPSTDTTRNNTDQVLEYFATALNKTGNTPAAQK